MKEFKEVSLGNNNKLYIHKTKKFKSIGIRIVYKNNYQYDYITAFAVLAKYLGNCCEKYPSIELCNKKIDSMYGSSFSIKYGYSGNCFQCAFTSKIINPKFVHDDNLLEDMFSFLNEIIYHPYIIDHHFDSQLFHICKENSLIAINGSKEYDMGYVEDKILKILFPTHHNAASAHYYGDKKVLNTLDEYNTMPYYQMLVSSPFDIYVTGDVTYKGISDLAKKYFNNKKSEKLNFNYYYPVKNVQHKPKIIIKNITQAHLIVAYTSEILHNDLLYYPMVLASIILSDSINSKFYRIIREKLGLCYYIGARYDATTGLFLIKTDLSSENMNQVINEINHQIDEMKNGNITDEELESARKMALSDLKMQGETLFKCISNAIYLKNLNCYLEDDEIIRRYQNISKEEVVNAAKTLQYSTYVCLKKDANEKEILSSC